MGEYIWVLQNSAAYFSLSTEDEFIDAVLLFSTENALDKYIKDNNIILGKNYLGAKDYMYWTKSKLRIMGE